MTKSTIRTGVSLAALGVALALSAPAFAIAADAPAAADQKSDALELSAVVVTASSADKTKLKSSLSVTDIKSDLVQDMAPTSQAEVLRLIPGMIVGDTAGPGGNANISVRGLPITTGGAPFVQLQEDGLPTVLFGDMNFGNNDYWIRFDASNSVQAVRGGSASTFASQAPGAVINYISATGVKQGGMVSVSEGLGYNETKLDFAYGGPINDTTRFHLDGFLKDGYGLRNEGFEAEKGYQFKGNLTKDFSDGKGYIRFLVKFLDDQEPTNTSYPVLASFSGNNISSISQFPGFDSRKGSTIGVYNQNFNVMNSSNGQLSQVPASGIHPVAQAYGTQVHYDFGNNLTVDDNFRYTVMSGSFSTQFQGFGTASGIIGQTVNGQKVGSVVLANGPGAGTAYTGFVNSGTQIYTHMGDMGSIANDLSASDKFETSVGKISAKAGLFYMDQTIAQDWHPNSQYQTLSGKNPQELNLISTTGQLLSNNGVTGYNTAWGAGVDRVYDMHVADTAPYIDLTWEYNKLQIEGSYRYDELHVSGWAESASSATTGTEMINGALVSYSTLDSSTYEALDYNIHYDSWSVGALYSLTDDISVFARASQGGKANTDRNILSGYTNGDGSLNASGAAKAYDVVKQDEVGIKTRGALFDGAYGLNLTYFHDQFGVSNYDLTQSCDPNNVIHGCYYQTAYKADGVEVEGSYSWNGLHVTGQITYTDAQVTKNLQGPTPTTLTNQGSGFAPPNTPALTYMFAPYYRWQAWEGGFIVQGQSKANVLSTAPLWAPAQTFVDAFIKYDIRPNIQVALHANNLFNDIGINGHSDQSAPAATLNGTGVITAPGELGRTVSISLTAKF